MSERKRPILVLDFDGVLHSYSSGWQGMTGPFDAPVPGAMQFLAEAVEAFEVNVISSRSRDQAGREAMRQAISMWLGYELGGASHAVLEKIQFPEHKPPAFVTIDDRAITFTGTFPSIGELFAFVPWTKRREP
jgi:hypothetical protein